MFFLFLGPQTVNQILSSSVTRKEKKVPHILVMPVVLCSLLLCQIKALKACKKKLAIERLQIPWSFESHKLTVLRALVYYRL